MFFKETYNPLKLLPVIRFASGSEKTECEEFMEYCHEKPPIIASLLSKNMQIELIEKAIETKPDFNWNSLSARSDALWYQYWQFCWIYFEGLKAWNPTDIEQIRYFCSENTKKATERLCKSLEFSKGLFFENPLKESVLNILRVYQLFLNSRNFIDTGYMDSKLSVFLYNLTQKSEKFLRLCVEKDCELNAADNNPDSTGLARYILVYSCLCCGKLILSVKHSEYDEEIVSKWCDVGTRNALELELWVDDVSGILIRREGQNSLLPGLNNQSIVDDYIRSCMSEYETLQNYLMEQKIKRGDIQVSFEDIVHYEVSRATKGNNSIKANTIISKTREGNQSSDTLCGYQEVSDSTGWYKGFFKDGLRDGYGEAGFPNGGKYKGEWREGKPNGYGIKKGFRGEETSGVFKDGDLLKSLPKMFVLLKLKRAVYNGPRKLDH